MLASESVILLFLGGFILFLFGIARMSEGMQRLSGERVRVLFSSLVRNRLAGGLLGLSSAILTQSSTASGIMTVGFVNAGLIPLVTAIAVVLGANLGASLTLQIVTLHPSQFLLPMLVLGTLLRFLIRNQHTRSVGQVILGLSLLILGLILMTAAFEPLRSSEQFRIVMTTVSDRLWLCLLLGLILTVILQSSTAVIAMTMAVAANGLLSLPGGVAIMFGSTVGACSGLIIAAIGANVAAKRLVVAALLLTLTAVTVAVIFLPEFLSLVAYVSPGDPGYVVKSPAEADWFNVVPGTRPWVTRHLANAHTLFSLLSFLVLLPLFSVFARLSVYFVQGQDVLHDFSLHFIDYRVLNTPPVAFGQARSEVFRMARLAKATLGDTVDYLRMPAEAKAEALDKKEQTLDLLQKEVTNFLVALSHRSASEKNTAEIVRLMHIVGDLERIGDHCQRLVRLTRRKREWRVVFSLAAEGELMEMATRTSAFLDAVVTALEAGNSAIQEFAENEENLIDELEETLRNHHINRLSTGECSVRPGLIFIDMLQAFEKISDHTYSIAKRVERGGQ